MKIKITADRMIDLPASTLEKYDISTISCYINMGGKSYSDLDDIQIEDVFRFIDQNKKVPTTAARSPEQYEAFFNSFLQDYEYVIHFACSSGISSIFNNATKAAMSLNEKVIVLDTRNLSNGIALLAIKATELVKKNHTVAEIVDIMIDMIPRIQGSFLLDKLTNLYYGGRCKGLVFHAANVFNLKIVISMEKDGRMAPRNKYRGSLSKSLKKYIRDTFELRPNPNLDQLYIVYSTKNDALINLIKEEVANYHHFKNIDVNVIGCNCAVHSGRNTYGIFYETKGE